LHIFIFLEEFSGANPLEGWPQKWKI
jgi:hypothetical protein